MTATALAMLVCLPQVGTMRPQLASVVYYSPGVFERTVRIRQRQGYKLPRTEGWTTSPNCSDIGKTLLLSVRGKTVRLTIADCSAPKDRARHIAQHTREVDYVTAKRLGIVREGRVRGLVWPGR